MRKHSLIFLLAAAVLSPSFALAQNAARTSLGLNGASVLELKSNADGSVVYATAEGPLGVFYSLDFGSTWSSALDNVYQGGQGFGLDVDAQRVYIVASQNAAAEVYVSSAAGGPVWSSLNVDSLGFGEFSPTSVHSDGNFVFVGMRENAVLVVNAQTLAGVGQSVIPVTPGFETGQVNYVAADATNGFIYTVNGLATGTQGSVWRAAYNPQTGAIDNASWTNVSPTGSGFYRVYVSPNNRLYITTFNGDSFQSTNNGASYNTLVKAGASAQSADFLGAVHVVGDSFSSDGGDTFMPFNMVFGDTTDRNGKAIVLHPLDSFTPGSMSARALESTSLGIAKTQNLSDILSSIWTASNNGLEGVVVNALAQLPSNKDTVLLATNNGFAFTTNFTSGAPNWQFPLRPLGQGLLADAAAFDPAAPNTVFAADTDIYRGTIASGNITFDTIRGDATPTGRTAFGFVTSLTVLDANTLVATWAERQLNALNGKVSFIDRNTGTETRAVLGGKPIQAFQAVSAMVMYAGAGARDTALPGGDDDANRGLYRSIDGGMTFNQVTDAELDLSSVQVLAFAYDADNDLLYLGLRNFQRDDDADDGDDDEDDDDDDGGNDSLGSDQGGAILILENASTESPTFREPIQQPSSEREITAIALDGGTGAVYASAGKFIYRSLDRGASWSVFFEGLENEDTSMLVFDDLVQGSNTGLYELVDSGLTSPAYLPWNGFLDMTNVYELSNLGGGALTLKLTLISPTGQESQSLDFTLFARQQFDFLINQLPGFAANSYGLVRLEWTGGPLSAKVAQYRSGANGFDFVRVFSAPRPLSGVTAVNFNSLNPSLNPADAGNIVSPFLTLANLDSMAAHSFTVEHYDQNGTMVSQNRITLAALGRFDLPQPTDQGIGLSRIVPDDAANYTAYANRFAATSANSFAYSFVVPASAGSGNDIWTHISNGANGVCFVEVSNALATPATFTLTYFDGSGQVVEENVETIAGYGQRHFNACSSFTVPTSGVARIRPASPADRLAANTAIYFYDDRLSVETAYLAPGVSASSAKLWVSWNRFLSLFNWLRIVNADDAQATFEVSIFNNANGLVNMQEFSVGANQAFDLGLHEASFMTNPDNYGLVSIESTGPAVIDLLRLRAGSGGARLDFATAIPAQP